MLPDFIVIGAMKCGTTSLHRYLDEHPQVCMSVRKEPDFFLKRTDRGLDWYKQQFEGEGTVCGEASPNYTKHPAFEGVPKRIHQLLPDVRLIYLVRDPVERALSHYVHNWEAKREHGPVEEVLCPPEESWYVNVSRYHYQVSRYLEYYAPENICVVESERLRDARVETLSEIFEFIGVEPDIEWERVQLEYHRSAEKQRPSDAAEFLIHTNIGQAVKNIGKAVVPSSWVERSKELLWQNAEKPTVGPEVRERVREFLREDVEKLRRLTGKEFASWSL